jgi:hypothetical protein
MTRRTIAIGVAATVLGGALTVGCQADDSKTKTQPKTQGAVTTLDCTDPGITMEEWRKRCAHAPASPGGDATKASDSTGKPSPSAGSADGKVAKVGDAISLKGFDGEKLDATVVKVVDPATSDNPYMKAKDGARLVAVQWRITNTGTKSIDSGPNSGSSLVDGDGQQFLPTFSQTTAGPSYPSGVTIPPGQSRLGFVAYEVPKSSAVVKAQYGANSGFADELGQWTLR